MKTLSIGRATENDVVINDAAVSARHAEMVWDGSALFIRDLGSTNGTFVNGRRIHGLTPVQLADRVTLGSSAVLDVADVQARFTRAASPSRITIGRAGDNTVVVNDPHVSAHHAALERRGSSWVLRDLGSTNGTYVNGVRATGETVLAIGDTVRFGKSGPSYRFPDAFEIAAESVQNAAVPHAPVIHDASAASATAVLPVFSSRTHMWRTPYVWIGFLVLVVMCLLFSYTGNPFAYNSYIYLFGLFSCATVLWFVYRLCGKRQPWWYMVAPAVFTAVMTVPVLVVLHALFPFSAAQTVSDSLVRRFLEETFITGLSEEFTKILPLLLVILYMQTKGEKSGQLAIREPLDGVLMAASSAIGFVVLETIFMYCNPERVRTDYQAWAALQLLIPRIFASVGGHVAYSGYFGYFIGLGMQHRQKFWQYTLIGYACAAVCHGLWNSVAPLGTPAMILASSVAYFLFMAAILRARATSHSALRQTIYGAASVKAK